MADVQLVIDGWDVKLYSRVQRSVVREATHIDKPSGLSAPMAWVIRRNLEQGGTLHVGEGDDRNQVLDSLHIRYLGFWKSRDQDG